jgi:hypothetical protein
VRDLRCFDVFFSFWMCSAFVDDDHLFCPFFRY